jgi:K+-transporting ATPase ATPase C chain
MWQQLMPGFRLTLILTILTGLIYPALITGICQVIFPRQANGTLIAENGRIVGSELIGQSFSKPEYFHPRPSAAGNGYDAMASGGSNLGPTSKKLIDQVTANVAKFRQENPEFVGPIPADIVTASASGLDPDISPEAADAQAARVARARGVAVQTVREVVGQYTQGRDLGFLGEPRVNVLLLNRALDQKFAHR